MAAAIPDASRSTQAPRNHALALERVNVKIHSDRPAGISKEPSAA